MSEETAKEVEELEAEITELKARVDELEEEVENAQSNADQAEDECAELEEKLRPLETSADCQARIEQALDDIDFFTSQDHARFVTDYLRRVLAETHQGISIKDELAKLPIDIAAGFSFIANGCTGTIVHSEFEACPVCDTCTHRP